MAELPEVIAYQARVAESEQRVNSLQAQLEQKTQQLSEEQSRVEQSIRNVQFRRGPPARPTVQKIQQLGDAFNLNKAGFESFQADAQKIVEQENIEVEAAYQKAQDAIKAAQQAEINAQLKEQALAQEFEAARKEGRPASREAQDYIRQQLLSQGYTEAQLNQEVVVGGPKPKKAFNPLEGKLIVGNEAVVGGFTSITGESVLITATGKKIVQVPADFEKPPVSTEVKEELFTRNIIGANNAISDKFVIGDKSTARFTDYTPPTPPSLKALGISERLPVTLNYPASFERITPREIGMAQEFTRVDVASRKQEDFLRSTGPLRPVFEVGGKIEEVIGEVGAFQGRVTYNLFVRPLGQITSYRRKTPIDFTKSPEERRKEARIPLSQNPNFERKEGVIADFGRTLIEPRTKIVFEEGGRALTQVGSFFIPGGKVYSVARGGIAVLSSRSVDEVAENLVTGVGFFAAVKGVKFGAEALKFRRVGELVAKTERVLDTGYLALSAVELGSAIATREQPEIKEIIRRKAASYGTIRLATGALNYGIAKARTGAIEFAASRNLPKVQSFLLGEKQLRSKLTSPSSTTDQLRLAASETSPRYRRELIVLEKEVKGLRSIIPQAKRIDISLVESLKNEPKAQKAIIEFYRRFGTEVVTGGSLVTGSNIRGKLAKNPADIDIYVSQANRQVIRSGFREIIRQTGAPLREQRGVFFIGREKVVEFPNLERVGFSNIRSTLGSGESIQSRIQTVEVVASSFKGKEGGKIIDPVQDFLAQKVIGLKGYIGGSGALTVGLKGFRQPGDIEGYFTRASGEKIGVVSEKLATSLSKKFGGTFGVERVNEKFAKILNPAGKPIADIISKPAAEPTVKVGPYVIRDPQLVLSDKQAILRYGAIKDYLQPRIGKTVADVQSVQKLAGPSLGIKAKVISPYTLALRSVYGGFQTAKGKTVYRYSKDIPRVIQSLTDFSITAKAQPRSNIPGLKQLEQYKASRFLEFVKTNYSDALTRSKLTPIPNKELKLPGFDVSFFGGFNKTAGPTQTGITIQQRFDVRVEGAFAKAPEERTAADLPKTVQLKAEGREIPKVEGTLALPPEQRIQFDSKARSTIEAPSLSPSQRAELFKDNRFELNLLGKIETRLGLIPSGTKLRSITNIGTGSQPVQDISKLTGLSPQEVKTKLGGLEVRGFRTKPDILSTELGSFEPPRVQGQQPFIRIAYGQGDVRTGGIIAHESVHAADFLSGQKGYAEFATPGRKTSIQGYLTNPFEQRATAVEGRFLELRGQPLDAARLRAAGLSNSSVLRALGEVPPSQVPAPPKGSDQFGLTLRGVIQTNLGFYPTRTRVGDVVKIGEQSQVVKDISTITGIEPKKLVPQLKRLDIQVLAGKDPVTGKPFPKENISGFGVDKELPGTDVLGGQRGAAGIALRRFQGKTFAEGAIAHELTHAGEFFAGRPQRSADNILGYSLSGSEIRARSVQQRFLASKGKSLGLEDLFIIGTTPEVKPLREYPDFSDSLAAKKASMDFEKIYAQAYKTNVKVPGFKGKLSQYSPIKQVLVEDYREGPTIGPIKLYQATPTIRVPRYTPTPVKLPKQNIYGITEYVPPTEIPAYEPPNLALQYSPPDFPGYEPPNITTPPRYEITPYNPGDVGGLPRSPPGGLGGGLPIPTKEEKQFLPEKKKGKIKKKKTGKGFDVFVLRNIKGKKQFLEVDDKGTSLLYEDAEKFGQNVTDRSLEASYFLKASKSPVAELRGLPGLSYKFRVSKQRFRKTIPVFVEKETYRLDTQSEVRKITAARVAAELRKNIIKPKSPSRAQRANTGFIAF